MALHVVERPPLEAGPANGSLVVLVHGSLDRASSFRRVAARLPDATVITYDRRGYAGSVEVSPTPVFERQVDDFLEVLGGRPVVGVGHSLGGDVVLRAAQRQPDLVTVAMVFEPPQPWLRSALRSNGPVFEAKWITVPVVCGYGSRSRPHHKEGTRSLAAALPHGELHCIDGSTHGAHLSHPGAFARLIRRALARDPGPSDQPESAP